MIYFSYPKAGYLKYSEEINKSIEDVLYSETYIKGENVLKFENKTIYKISTSSR